MTTKGAVLKIYSELNQIPVDHLLFFKNRFRTLLTRGKKIADLIETCKYDENDIMIQQTLDLLGATFEEVGEYIFLFSTKTNALANHIIMYGSDEEQFVKWGERLQHCVDGLGLNSQLSDTFNDEIDYRDFNQDLEDLRSGLVEILEMVLVGSTKIDIATLIKSLESMLGQQSRMRSTYQTKTAPTAALEINPKKIRYEKIVPTKTQM